MKRKKISALLLCAALLAAMVTTAFADIGPKPSVRVDFVGSSGEPCYGTLLSKEKSTGPASAYEDRSDEIKTMYQDNRDMECDSAAAELWEAFQHYEDPDGFYFLQQWWTCTDGNQLAWTYYPPQTFKLLLYYPDTGEYRVSPVCERKQFHSLYEVDLSKEELSLTPQYPAGRELATLLVRMVLTLALELLVAIPFGYRAPEQIKLLAVVNGITQLALNVSINLIDRFSGFYALILGYILLELLVFGAEAYAYVRLMPRYSSAQAEKGHPVLYALCANLVSFGAGLWLSLHFPNLF